MGNKLFGTDGIRGIAGSYPLDREYVYRIGYCAGELISQSARTTVIMGRDTRGSG